MLGARDSQILLDILCQKIDDRTSPAEKCCQTLPLLYLGQKREQTKKSETCLFVFLIEVENGRGFCQYTGD